MDDIWWFIIGFGNLIVDFEIMKNIYGIFQVLFFGVIIWFLGVLFLVMCDMKLQKFFFDMQMCDFVFVVFGYIKKDIVINVNLDILNVQGIIEWDILEIKIFEFFGGSNGLNICFMFQRKLYFVFLMVIMFLILFLILNIFVFLILVELGEKILYVIFIFLVYFIYLFVMGFFLFDDVEFIVYMMLYIEIMMFLSVFIMVLVIIQIWLVFYYGDDLLFCCLENSVMNEEDIDVISIDFNDKLICKENEFSKFKKRIWFNSMVMIDRILFVFFFLVFCIFNIFFFILMLR